jgi:hypothetical protein
MITLTPEHRGDDEADGIFVLHKQNGFVAAGRSQMHACPLSVRDRPAVRHLCAVLHISFS